MTASTGEAGTLYLIDGHAQFFRAYHAIRSGMKSPVTGEPTNMTFGFSGILLKLIRDYQPDYLAVVIDVEKGNHIQSHTPLSAGFIATDVFVEPTNGVTLGHPQFPKHKVRSLPGNLKVAEYGGRVVIRVDGVAEDSLAGESVRFAGVVRYQACNDKGQCYRPQNIRWEIEVPAGARGEKARLIEYGYKVEFDRNFILTAAAELDAAYEAQLAQLGIPIHRGNITEVHHHNGKLRRLGGDRRGGNLFRR